jgi:hypothetical protein
MSAGAIASVAIGIILVIILLILEDELALADNGKPDVITATAGTAGARGGKGKPARPTCSRPTPALPVSAGNGRPARSKRARTVLGVELCARRLKSSEPGSVGLQWTDECTMMAGCSLHIAISCLLHGNLSRASRSEFRGEGLDALRVATGLHLPTNSESPACVYNQWIGGLAGMHTAEHCALR